MFYISNRDTSLITATMSNMKRLGFPQIERTHFLFKSNTGSKEGRRREVAKSDTVVLLLGDNLNDFDSIYETKPIDIRKFKVDRVKNIWGDRFIVLPNAIYGDWENAFIIIAPDLESIKKIQCASVESFTITLSKLFCART